jgi:hypothetical protein
MENNRWRNLRASHFNTGAWYAGFAILAENGPLHYGSRSVVIDTIHAGAYKTYGFAFAGCNALRAVNLFAVENFTPSVADLYLYGNVNNSNNLCYFAGGGIGWVRIEGTGSSLFSFATISDLGFGSTAASNTVVVGDWTGAYSDVGTNNTVYAAKGVYHAGAKIL